MDDLVTVDAFIQQVWDVEGVKIEVKQKEGTIEHLVRPYKYKLSDQEILALLQEKIKIDDTKFYLVINFENEYTKNSVSEEY